MANYDKDQMLLFQARLFLTKIPLANLVWSFVGFTQALDTSGGTGFILPGPRHLFAGERKDDECHGSLRGCLAFLSRIEGHQDIA
jgi:hypothetical protein